MGSCASKSQIAVTPVKANIELKIKENDDLISDPNVLLDPRSPDIHRTPLTDILGNRLNYRQKIEQLPQTPINSLRTKLLNYSINEKKLLDPRSPSQFIPRTPLNLSFDDNSKIEGNTALYSIEYNGNIEDESCRNFYERLANITFDDADNEIGNESKLPKHTLKEIKEEDIADTKFIPENKIQIHSIDEEDSKKSVAESIHQTPTTVLAAVSKFNVDLDVEEKNISPIICNTVQTNRTNDELTAFSSTPIVTTNSQLKKLLLKSHIKKVNKPEIFEDDEFNDFASDSMMAGNRSEDEILSTPIKRLIKDIDESQPRTPLGVLNRRSRSVESLSQRQSRLNLAKDNERTNDSRSKLNDENIFFTPQTKKRAIRQKNSGLRQRVPIFND